MGCRWMGAPSMVARPAMSFPLASYEAQGADLIVQGSAAAVLQGDAWGVLPPMLETCRAAVVSTSVDSRELMLLLMSYNPS